MTISIIPAHDDQGDDDADHNQGSHIHGLLDAIELIETNRLEDARAILRGLIHQNSNFEDAWLWMSVAVDSLDQAVICLDHVLRINPANSNAANALAQLQEAEYVGESKRNQLRVYRDWSMLILWLMIMGLIFAILVSSMLQMTDNAPL